MNRPVNTKHKKSGTSSQKASPSAWTRQDIFEVLRGDEDFLKDDNPGVLKFGEALQKKGQARECVLLFISHTFAPDSAKPLASLGLDHDVEFLNALWGLCATEDGRTRSLKRAREILRKARPDEPVAFPKFSHHFEFDVLSKLEAAWLAKATPGDEKVDMSPVTREPWVAEPARDYFGLALSGGGIRSATFNLGLLQTLEDKGVLKHVDYLSTVSGGGYVGGFWTAWLHHHGDAKGHFPARDANTREPSEIRHLREFSRFLVPRVGFGQSETWMAITAVLGGTLMSVIVIASAVAVVLNLWFFAVSLLEIHRASWGLAVFGLLTLWFHLASERRLGRLGKLGTIRRAWGSGFVVAILSTLGWALLAGFGREPSPVAFQLPASWASWQWQAAPALVWGGTALVLLLFRGLFQRLMSVVNSGALDRAVTRCLAPALVALAMTALWQLAEYLRESEQSWWAEGVGVFAAGFAGIFAWLRDWLLKEPAKETRGSKLLERLQEVIKPVLPQVAAVMATLLFILGIAIGLQAVAEHFGEHGPAWAVSVFGEELGAHVLGFGITLIVLLLSLWVFDPAGTGLHEFYRARIARCFLGAARSEEGAQGNVSRPAPATTEQPEDDLTFGQLPRKGPIHLVCCAANNLQGDTLGSLYRGARSAMISQVGLSVGNFATRRDDLRLSSVMTASAAAFNSQMGSYSMRLGPAVAFVMCLLNLRLGLWVRHPVNPSSKTIWPGLPFIFEALGLTRSDQAHDEQGANLHLSDGGHFENLGLYELVRRHCRYIIVSDATSDPDYSFDDLGNAIRRIREDFGVEIELDVTHLIPNEKGFATRHAAIGTIHFDGLGGTDKGLIIYFKPVLTGDEPTDVLEYRTRTKSFPQDGAADQFYDEAQWESYRRLGQHSGAAIPSEASQPVTGSFVDRMFLIANQRWQVLEDSHREAFLRLTERCAALESEIRDQAPKRLVHEFFPEVKAALGPAGKGAAAASTTADDEAKILYFLVLVSQIMEDVWLSADLERKWAHPLNEGWMNYFRRWTSTQSFKTWWPVLRPFHDPRFRDFVKERFDLKLNEQARGEAGPGARLKLKNGSATMLTYELELQTGEQLYSTPIRVGKLTFTEDKAKSKATWKEAEFAVNRELKGSGIESRFLDAVVAHLGGKCDLEVELEGDSRSPAQREAFVQTVAFYKSRGFHYALVSPGGTQTLIRPRAS